MTETADPIALAQALIRCESITPVEGGALAFLEQVLGAAGYEVHRPVFSTPGTPDVENLYARIGEGAPCFVFAGHTDVVPPGNLAAWTHPPFAAEIVGDQLFGRGAADMKGGVAAFLAAALRHGKPERGSIAFVITGDEEGPSINGTRALLEWAAARGEKLDHCVVGEPTNPNALGDAIKVGRRGSLSGTLTVSGKQGHAAYPHLANNPIRGLVPLLAVLLEPPLDAGTAHFEPSNLEIVSVDVGNPAFNVIPGEVRTRFNVRFNDSWTFESLKDEIEARLAAAAPAGCRYALHYEPGISDCFLTEPGAFVDLVADSVEETTGRRPALTTNGGTSDARFFKDYCPVVEFGLINQTIHQVDEHIDLGDLVALTDIYEAMLARYFSVFASTASG